MALVIMDLRWDTSVEAVEFPIRLVRHGRIDLGCHFEQWLEDVEAAQCIRFLPVTPRIASLAPALPEHHKDPQDRLIIATAIIHDAQLLSFDTAFPAYQELKGRLIDRSL